MIWPGSGQTLIDFDDLVPMARIERATSPLPRGCSTTEPHGHRYGSGGLHLHLHLRLPLPANRQARIDTSQPEPTVERETGIEPVSLAWKAKVLPLNYSRIVVMSLPLEPDLVTLHLLHNQCGHHDKRRAKHTGSFGGGGWIRTSVGVSQQIYSLPPLATRAPLRRACDYNTP